MSKTINNVKLSADFKIAETRQQLWDSSAADQTKNQSVNVSVAFGIIAKWLADFGTAAFEDTTAFAASGHTHALNGNTITGTLPVNKGGTGANTLASGQVLIGNGTSAVGTREIASTVSSASSTKLVTEGAVASAGYVKSSGVTSITPGDGIVNGSGTTAAITSTGTLKAALANYTKATIAADTGSTATAGRFYPIALDKNGKMAVAVPWTTPVTSVAGRTGAVTLTHSDIGGLGTAATANTESTLTNGSNLPTGAAITTYVSNQIGALGNILINLKANKEVAAVLDELGFDLNAIEDEEPDPALGNGGLGRLAACFLDSLATLGYPACGCGIRYKYGMFKQKIENGFQVEVPDNWLKEGYPFEMCDQDNSQIVKFGGYVRMIRKDDGREYFIQEGYSSVEAVPYDIPIVGYNNHFVNTLRIWDARAIDTFQLDSFDKGDYHKAVEQQNLANTIVEVLYPNDNHYAGKELRLKQQYFFVSASVQLAIKKYLEHHDDIKKLPEKVCFQLNDTHPSVTVAELMRILMDEHYLTWDEAWDITTRACAYTNHTIMSEALEKWPLELFSRLLPRIYQIVEEINRRFIREIQVKYPGDYKKIEKMAIVYDGQVRMANLAIVGGFSVNGVARLHTEILKNQSLKEFADYFPGKFNNKTNGITQRRFLLHGNPLLADWVTEKIGADWITDLSKMDKLSIYADDERHSMSS
jgi:hypothetical protein